MCSTARFQYSRNIESGHFVEYVEKIPLHFTKLTFNEINLMDRKHFICEIFNNLNNQRIYFLVHEFYAGHMYIFNRNNTEA